MPAQRWNNRETTILMALAAATSILAFLHYFHQNQILLYGDAEGHINIARRVFDSRSPGPLQLGTVWLPLPHLLMIPFLISDWAWRTATGGSIPSMIAYIVSIVGIFRLVRTVTKKTFPAWFAALVFAGNPSLLYLQATAMTEPLYLALFTWAIAYLAEFAQAITQQDWPAARRSLNWCGLVLATCTMTRYDGWIAMSASALAVLFIVFRARKLPEAAPLKKPILRFLLICAAGPTLWLAYNTAVYRNPLEFANGPYSAKAIEHRIQQASHPGTDHPWLAELYFLRAAEMNLAGNPSAGKLWLLLAAIGTLLCLRRPSFSPLPLLLLWIPLPFYALSVAYGGVPIFVPDWWPFGVYNLRYGLQLLPAVAVFSAISLDAALSILPSKPLRIALSLAAITLWFWGALQSSVMPASYLEAVHNMQGRVTLQERLAVELDRLPPNATILMAIRDFPGAPQRAGVHFRRIINEGDQRAWIRPHDDQGLWFRALANPQQYVDYALAFAGDPVDASAKANHLTPIFTLEIPTQPRATLYRTR
jgi:hypothetical protein